MPATLAHLLARPELGLRLLTSPGTGSLDRPIPWVHSSELADPTPFLSEGQVLLVTGTPDDVEPYVERLVAHGIAGLGFGTDVVRDGTPDALADACERHGLPLFEVPYRTPFIAITRFVADSVAADAYARSTWALRASRAISLAALRPDALGAVLAELARQIEHPVALVGAAGAVERAYPPSAVDGAARSSLAAAAEPLLRGGRRAGSTVEIGGESFALQTLGAAGRLRGVVAVGGGASLDQAAQQVVTGVVALAGLALEQSRATDAARSRLRTAVWRALLAGDRSLAVRVAEPVVGPLPEGSVRVALLAGDGVPAAADWLELHPETAPEFFARDGGDLVLLTDTATSADVTALVERFGLRGGVSGPASPLGLAAAVAQASAARDGATAELPLRGFDDLAAGGMLALLHTDDARAVAAATLEPLAADPALVAALRTWLDHNGVYDVAARELGIHRHTLRARVAEAERLLGRDLTPFAARADLYAALATL
ncbi:PucR family transcriptional regulator [Leifsonia sp. NPDC058292]|uniref:PucR family transcriptional regulator n=1 Tax=Leifsonia sp. NPDC058292 TaxID=3346428 RepID=UPI0036D8D203